MDEITIMDKLLDQSIDAVIDDAQERFLIKNYPFYDPSRRDAENKSQNSEKNKPQYYKLTENDENLNSNKSQNHTSWTDKSQNQNETDKLDRKIRNYRALYNEILGIKSQSQEERSDRSNYNTLKEDKSQYNDILGITSQSQEKWSDKSNYNTLKEDKSQYNDILGIKSQSQEKWSDKSNYNTLKEDKSQYNDILGRKPQLENEWTDKSSYKIQREDKSQFDDILGKKPQFGNEWNDKSNYKTNEYKPQYHDTLGKEAQYQYPWEKPGYKNTQSVPSTPWEDKSQNDSFLGRSQYNVQRQEIPKYQNTSANEPQHSSRQVMSEGRSSRSEPIENGKFNTASSDWEDFLEYEQKQDSFQKRYEEFRKQKRILKDMDQSSKKQGPSEVYEKNVRTIETQKSSNKCQSGNSSTVQPQNNMANSAYKTKEASKSTVSMDKGAKEEDNGLQMVSRGTWGALPSTVTLPRLQAPADTLVFSLDTKTSPCDTPKECMRRVREIQARQMGEGLGDIQYSYLLGGDGYVYEGRGLDYEGGAKRKAGEGANINIAYIGKYKREYVPKLFLENVHKLTGALHEGGYIKVPAVRLEDDSS